VLEVGAPERVLAIECGDGEPALFLSREFPSARVRGVDRSEQAIRRATERVGLDPEGRVAFKVGGPRRLPFPADLFDLVALLDAEPPPREVGRVLRPGGFLVVARSDGGHEDGVAARLRSWRLRRRGLEPIWAEAAGGGSYAVRKLRGGPPLAAE
jgi:ubiquinone/menaquinone biosynthesis C-methylase UbiE